MVGIGHLIGMLCLSLGGGQTQDRGATPAVVNPAIRSVLRQTLSLDGDWDFATDPSGTGEQQEWFRPDRDLPNRVALRVPGCWEAQGVGGPGPSVPVTPERSIRPLRGSYVGTACPAARGSWAGFTVLAVCIAVQGTFDPDHLDRTWTE